MMPNHPPGSESASSIAKGANELYSILTTKELPAEIHNEVAEELHKIDEKLWDILGMTKDEELLAEFKKESDHVVPPLRSTEQG